MMLDIEFKFGGMKMKNYKLLIVTLGVFGIINTEMGVIGILPNLAEHFDVSIANAGMFVSLFAFAVAIAGPTMPLLCSRFPRKRLMVFILGAFTICNLISALSDNFTISLLARSLPAFLHPVYISMAFTLASTSVEESEAPKAVAKVMVGVSAGMVLGVPMVSFLASTINITSAMLFFALVNALVLLATIFFLPSSAPAQKVSYKDQLAVLKQSRIWVSMIAVLLLNGSVFGVYSYISNSLSISLGLSSGTISIVLFAYGVANIVGNMIAGRSLSKMPLRFIFTVLLALGSTYVLQYFFVDVSYPFLILLVIWGILAGCVGNINQY